MHKFKICFVVVFVMSFFTMIISQFMLKSDFLKSKLSLLHKMESRYVFSEQDVKRGYIVVEITHPSESLFLLQNGEKMKTLTEEFVKVEVSDNSVIEIDGRDAEEVQKDMESKTRQILRKNEKACITTREITRDELPVFKSIMEHTGDRRDFIDRPLSYYEAMWDNLHDSGILKILIADIDFDEYLENTKKELEETEKALKSRIYKHDNNILQMNEKKYNNNYSSNYTCWLCYI